MMRAEDTLLYGGDRRGNGWPTATSGAFRRREEPLACLREQAIAGRFHAWHGRSSRRYLATIYHIDHEDPAACLPDLGPAVLLAVSRRAGARTIVGSMAVERGSDWAQAVARLHGRADEWHVHLLAPDRAARAAVLADLHGGADLAIVA